MDASSPKTNVNETCMGRSSEETLEENTDDRDIKELVVSREFGSPESQRGSSSHVLENWIEHQAERLRPIHITLSESSDALTVRADVPGVNEENLKINVEPARVVITRRPAAMKGARTIYSAPCSGEGTHVIDLPNPVTVNKVRMGTHDGVLELDLVKAEPAKQEGIEPKTA